jgi:putative SOS response-associated peptidase YedK
MAPPDGGLDRTPRDSFPIPADDLEAYEVSTLVNSPRNDTP